MLSGVIKPSNEDKSGNIKCSNNYREVMISTIFFLSCRVHDATIHQIDYKHSSYQFAYRCDSSIPFLPMLFYEKKFNGNVDGDSTIYSCLLNDEEEKLSNVSHCEYIWHRRV